MKDIARRRGLLPLIAITATLAGIAVARAQTAAGPDLSIELVDPKVLRVCADPHNLPFSNDKGEGFENKLGELFAQAGRQVHLGEVGEMLAVGVRQPLFDRPVTYQGLDSCGKALSEEIHGGAFD